MKSYLIKITGTVQGVGFRPFIYCLANEFNIKGYVYNNFEGVLIFCEGDEIKIKKFIEKISLEKPKISVIEKIQIQEQIYQGYLHFQIKDNQDQERAPLFTPPPDFKICDECLNELMDRTNRRYLYPFINCAQCGPRFTIIKDLPYTRSQTTMSVFKMCGHCSSEYTDPTNRRYHAEPIACGECGPKLQFYDSQKNLKSCKEDALNCAISAIISGQILALKGIGGYQLLVRATDEDAVTKLRLRKQRPSKPFAIMVKNLKVARTFAELSYEEEEVLQSPTSPIVLIKKSKESLTHVNPGNPYVGLMLATTPLHFLILNQINEPLIVTSGNLSDESLCIHNEEALDRLGKIADCFLIHDRGIERPIDDSIIQIVNKKEMVLRRARGYSPQIFTLKKQSEQSILALGTQLKNTFSFSNENKLILSQHIGDLENLQTQKTYSTEIRSYKNFYKLEPKIILHDLHPEYVSSRLAYENFKPQVKVAIQHHEAHAWAGIYEHQLETSDLCIAVWDGAGYGTDGSIWGGEFFNYSPNTNILQRVACIEPFLLLGSEKSFREPWRVLLSLLFQYTDYNTANRVMKVLNLPVTDTELEIMYQAWQKKLNSPETSSMGRIFDAVSCMLGLTQFNSFEAEAAMNLQFCAEQVTQVSKLNKCITTNIKVRPEWVSIDFDNKYLKKSANTKLDKYLSFANPIINLAKIIIEKNQISEKERSEFACAFHFEISLALIDWVKNAKQKKLLVTGGVFQNRLLLEILINLCKENELELFFPQQIPIGDGGVSIGQMISYLS